MNLPVMLESLVQPGAGLLVGLLVGWLHFSTLALNLRLFTEGRLAAAIPLQLLRVGLTVGVLASLIRLGPGALLAGALGLLLARQWRLWRRKEASR